MQVLVNAYENKNAIITTIIVEVIATNRLLCIEIEKELALVNINNNLLSQQNLHLYFVTLLKIKDPKGKTRKIKNNTI